MRSLRGFAVLMLCIAPLRPSPLPAQNPAPGASWIEAGGFYQGVTNGFGDWRGAYGRAVIAGSRNVWYLDARAQEAFRDRGVYGSVANVHTLSSRVYSQLGIGGGTGEFVLPDLRLDASLSVKLGRARRVIATAGATWVDAKSGYRDRSVFGALTWYAAASVMIEGGSRLTWSNPGNVASGRGYGSLSLGRTGSTLVTMRGSAGSEGYQLIGATQTLNRFDSQEAGVTLRQWIGGSSGLVVGGDWYHNPFYTRSGASVGLFHAW